MKKIGIVTHYYNSTNYGGSLQAYALCKALHNLGYDAEQIQIDHSKSCYDLTDTSALAPIKKLVGKPVKQFLKTAVTAINPRTRREDAMRRANRKVLLESFSSFNQNLTPHSQEVYNEINIWKAVQKYDAFITGSDQVWNPNWYFAPFFLSFVPSGVTKLSYAASISHASLSNRVKAVYQDHLKDFSGISVREEDCVQLLQDISPKKVSCVLDPTLLLSPQNWAQVTAPTQVDGKYAFCYFLGDDPEIRQTAANYAKEQGLTLVTIPHAAGIIHRSDLGFGDLQIEAPSVEVFLSLIQNASYVFTDSFHASVFSLIFQRQFVAFARNSHKHMSSRLYHLTNLFDIPERFCDNPEQVDHRTIGFLPPIDYQNDFLRFQEAKQFSLDFLANNLK